MLPTLAPDVAERELTREEVAESLTALWVPAIDGEAKKSFLTAWATRGETATELAVAAEVLLTESRDPGLRGSWNGQPLLDCCGTGGGGLNLLNISTGIVFILAAMGIPVVKHGNRGITKKSGSADVLEAFGIKIDLRPEQLKACLEKVGAVFLYAPFYHTTFAAIAPLRQQLAAQGQRTIFNLLGPLLNPARPDARLVGVFKPEHVDLYHAAFEKMGCSGFTIACGTDSPSGTKLGEISARGPNYLQGHLRQGPWAPDSFTEFASTSTVGIETLLVRDAKESAERLHAVLSNDASELLARDTLLINAAVAAWTQGKFATREEAYSQAKEALDSRRALQRLQAWQGFSFKL
jgi:anthranilate phosphoribosyltransferase